MGDSLEVTERKYTIGEVMKAEREGRLLEAFGAGTAVSSSPWLFSVFDEYELLITDDSGLFGLSL